MKKRYYMLPIYLVCFLFFFCGHPIKKIEIDFCEILKKDQSHINTDKSNRNYHKDKAYRENLLNKNFELLTEYIKQKKLPKIEHYKDIPCLNEALQITLIHTAQINQQELFSQKNIDLLQKQINQGRLDKELLKRAIIVMSLTSKICKRHQSNIVSAIKAWELNNEIYNEKSLLNFVHEINYSEC